MVQRTLVRPPNSRVGPITEAERRAVVAASPVEGVYDEAEERDSAYERCRSGPKTARRRRRKRPREGGGEEVLKRFAQRQLLDDARQDHHSDRGAIGDEVLTDALKGRTRRGG